MFFSADPGDKLFPTDRSVYIVWALGRLDENKEPTFHDIYSKSNKQLNLTQEPSSDCVAFTRSENKIKKESWTKGHIYDKTIRNFKAYVGPSGGRKGYQATTG